jgi:hypothetical protein
VRPRLAVTSIRQALIAGLAVIAIGGAAYWVFELGLYKPSVVERGYVTATDERGHNRITAATRKIVIGRQSHAFWQVEIAPDVWKDCGKDCAAVLRKAAIK